MEKTNNEVLTSDQIPEGFYCYTIVGTDDDGNVNTKLCPYWDKDSEHTEQDNGYCLYMRKGDWELNGISLLWDQCKACGERLTDDHDYI